LLCLVTVISSLLPPSVYTTVKRHSAPENIVVHSKVIDFEPSEVTHHVVALTSQWEEFGGYSVQVVRNGAAL